MNIQDNSDNVENNSSRSNDCNICNQVHSIVSLLLLCIAIFVWVESEKAYQERNPVRVVKQERIRKELPLALKPFEAKETASYRKGNMDYIIFSLHLSEDYEIRYLQIRWILDNLSKTKVSQCGDDEGIRIDDISNDGSVNIIWYYPNEIDKCIQTPASVGWVEA